CGSIFWIQIGIGIESSLFSDQLYILYYGSISYLVQHSRRKMGATGLSGSLEEKVEYDRAVYEEALNDVTINCQTRDPNELATYDVYLKKILMMSERNLKGNINFADIFSAHTSIPFSIWIY
ncbi:hypothetical protein ACJX0J_017631, partial [Zea mays]